MRSSGVMASRTLARLQDWSVLALAALLILAICVPEAEAARRKRQRAPVFVPPYASIVFDVNANKVLEETNANALRHPASVTKVMTLYLLFEQLEKGKLALDTPLRVSAFAARQPPSKLGLKPGETIEVDDAIKALVTKSANDVAVVVAEAVGGDEERFAAQMTRKAQALGMSRTVFRNASGLPNSEQVTTARDLVTLGRAIQDRFPKFYGYFSTRSFHFAGATMRNHNNLLGRVEGVDGIKTGYTHASGFNLLTSAKVDGRHLITVVLGGRTSRARDARVAALVGEHMPRAYAGRRLGNRSIEVASRDDDDEAPAPIRVASPPPVSAPVIAPPAPAPESANDARASNLPVPPGRPRPAVIAEIRESEPGLTRARPLALAASGSTGIVASATSPLALVGTTPRSPALRWVTGAQPAQPAQPAAPRQASQETRLVPPGSVRFTNGLADGAVAPEPDQPLPAAEAAKPALAAAPPVKVEQRLSSTPPETQIVALLAPSQPSKAAKSDPAKSEPVKSEAVKPAPARSGWVIQLGATDSEGKARSILQTAREKIGAALRDAEPFTEPVAKGATTLFRARFAGFDAEEAQNACKLLKKSGFSCFAQKI